MRKKQTPPERPQVPPRRSAAAGRWLLRLLVGVGVVLLLLAGLGLFALHSEAGARTVWQLALRALPGKLSGELVGGTLRDGLALRKLSYRDSSRLVQIDHVSGRWQATLSPPTLTITALQLDRIEVTQYPTPPTPRTMPASLRLPLAIDLRRATLKELVLHKDGKDTVFGDIRLSAQSDRVHHVLTLDNATTPVGKAQATLRLDGRSPFPLKGSARLEGAYLEEHYRLDAGLAGNLRDLVVQLHATGDRLTGSADIAATPFAQLPFKQAQVDLHHLNPRLFSAGAPQADIALRATLTPAAEMNGNVDGKVDGKGTSADTQSPEDLSQLRVAGPVRLTNARPGPLDKELLPLASVAAQVSLSAGQQQLTDLRAALVGGATLEGGGTLNKGGNGDFTLQAADLDLHALHGKLAPTQLQGPLQMKLAQGRQHVELRLTDRAQPLQVEADADLRPQQIVLNTAQLSAGPARLQLQGKLGRDAQSAYTVTGKLTDFNPGAFLATMHRSGKQAAGKRTPKRAPATPDINARINADFSAEGRLKPELAAKVRFDIHDSQYDGLPMTGGGRIDIAGQRLQASDLQLAMAGNTLQAKGAFGNAGDRLDFKLDAPALARLGFGLSGLLQADGRVGGTQARPIIDTRYRGENLAFGDYRLATLSGQAHTSGLPGDDPKAQVALELNAGGLQAADTTLRELTAHIAGTYASHTIDVRTTGQLRGRPLALKLAAQGQLRELQPERDQQRGRASDRSRDQGRNERRGLAWDGTLHTLENRGFPRLALKAPLTVSVAPGQVVLGATRLEVEQAQIDLGGFAYRQGRIDSAGSLQALDVGHLLELQRELTGDAPPLKTDLMLDGEWKVALGAAADGFVRIERRRGDVSLLDGTRAIALDLNALALRADLRGNRIDVDGNIAAGRIGSANARVQVTLQQSEGLLAVTPDAQLAGRITATIPRLQRIASLAGPRIALDGNAAMDIALGGTLADPQLAGTVNGDQLALTLFDQGVRLRDGIARIQVDNNIVELRQVEFHGGEGTLRASGRIPLDRSSPDLHASIVADRLQLLASPSAQLTLSGQADAANNNEQLQVTGKFKVDHALFSLPEKSAPKLDDDVVVIRGKQRIPPPNKSAEPKRAGPLAPQADITVDLGDDFRFEGSGAKLRLVGTVDAHSAPGETLQAEGTVRVASGSYKAFGTELEIERGLINFQGPPTNPNLNIRAMRLNKQEVEVRAGVQVTGTVKQPRVELVSEPNVSDEEKLSWLVFGRSGGNTDPGQAQAAAKGAALGLLNSMGGSRIAKSVGLDQLSIGSSEFGLENQQVVNLGKEVSDRLYVGFEQSLAGGASVVKLTYELSRYWSVVARGGTISGLDMLYSRRFDALGRSRTAADR